MCILGGGGLLKGEEVVTHVVWGPRSHSLYFISLICLEWLLGSSLIMIAADGKFMNHFSLTLH